MQVRVRCVVGRMIGDGVYVPGEEYVLDADQAAKYATLGYFVVLGPVDPATASAPQTKMSPAPENKVLRGGANKRDRQGWPNRQGVNVHLDGSPVE